MITMPIRVNTELVVYRNDYITYEQVLGLAGIIDDGDVYTMTYSRGRNMQSGEIHRGQTIYVNEGMSLSVCRTDNA